jgi:hypothetical protein
MPMRERQEIQEVLWRLSAADHAASRPGFDSGRINEIRWYGTRGIKWPQGALFFLLLDATHATL